MSHKALLALARLTSSSRFSPQLDVARLEVRLPDLPVALEGFTIAQVSDLHVGAGAWEPMRASEAADLLQAEGPDVVVNTGDYLQGAAEIAKVLRAARPFVIQRQPDVQGAVNLAVLGNHDYYAGDAAVRDLSAGLADIGVRLLLNETACVVRQGAEITFAGLSQSEAGFEDAIARLSTSAFPRIVLVHDGDVAGLLDEGSADLILAGHTHGGQITLPGLGPIIVRRFNGSMLIEGWYCVNGNRLYINRGLGCTGLPVRFRAAPEVTIFRLRR